MRIFQEHPDEEPPAGRWRCGAFSTDGHYTQVIKEDRNRGGNVQPVSWFEGTGLWFIQVSGPFFTSQQRGSERSAGPLPAEQRQSRSQHPLSDGCCRGQDGGSSPAARGGSERGGRTRGTEPEPVQEAAEEAPEAAEVGGGAGPAKVRTVMSVGVGAPVRRTRRSPAVHFSVPPTGRRISISCVGDVSGAFHD